MKLRQKLAVVLASAMIITAVPVVTSAASTNGFNKTVSMVEGTELTTTSAVNLDMKFDAEATAQQTTFFVDAQDFEFNANEYKIKANNALKTAIDQAKAELEAAEKALAENKDEAQKEVLTQAVADKKAAVAAAEKALNDTSANNLTIGNATISVLSKTQLKVTVTVGTTATNVSVPVLGTAKKGTPSITVDGSDSLATSGKYSLATGEVVSNKSLVATAGTVKNISVDGEGAIADITIEEKVAGTLKNGSTIKVTLPNSSDLDFKSVKEVAVEGVRGLAGQTTIKAEVVAANSDEKTLELKLSGVTASTTRGGIKLKGIQVEAENKKEDVKTGEVKVTVKAAGMEDTKLVVANVTDFGVKLNVEEEVELVAGRDAKTVKVTLEEAAIASLNQRQDVYLNVDGANIVPGSVKVIEGGKTGATNVVTQELDAKKEKVTGLVLDTAQLDANAINKVVFEFEVEGRVDNTGDITLTAESRSFQEDITLKLGTVKETVKVEAAPMTVKVGLKDQKGGKVVITETDAEMLPRGEQIVIEVAKDSDNGIRVTDATVKAEDMKIKDVKVKDGKIFFTIDRTSEEAGTITITDITVDTDRTVPEGKFDLVIGGEAISKHNNDTTTDAKHFEDAITVADFFVVGTPNTEDNSSNGLKKGTGIFKVGEKSYTVNGEAKEMDAAPYISKANRVMVPVRYVSDVFGINGNDVLFSNENGGTITIFAGNRVLQVVNGSNVALVNGVKVPMDEKVTIVDGRTFVPVGEMGRLLNVDVEWSNETKTATFSNK